MGLLSFLQSKIGDASSGPEAGSVDAARARARRRLVGATVLVLVGVIGFPLLFDRAPRPLPVDLPIEIPRKEAVPPLVAKAPPVAAKAASAAEAGATPPAPEAAAPAPAKGEDKASAKPVDRKADKAEPLADGPGEPPSASAVTEAARAQAALEGRPIAAAAKAGDTATRFVVQVGAFSEADSAREVRAKVEKLGLKTYTQVIDTSAGKRIRVRLGPYSDRAEAERIAAQIKQAGLAPAVLTL